MYKVNTTERLTMSIRELAQTLGISNNLAYNLARKNDLPVPVINLGGKRMVVSRAAVLKLMAKNKELDINLP
jgi:excisionase family DNA binding protein